MDQRDVTTQPSWFSQLPTAGKVAFALLLPVSLTYAIVVMWKQKRFGLGSRVALTALFGLGMLLFVVTLASGLIGGATKGGSPSAQGPTSSSSAESTAQSTTETTTESTSGATAESTTESRPRGFFGWSAVSFPRVGIQAGSGGDGGEATGPRSAESHVGPTEGHRMGNRADGRQGDGQGRAEVPHESRQRRVDGQRGEERRVLEWLDQEYKLAIMKKYSITFAEVLTIMNEAAANGWPLPKPSGAGKQP